MIVLDFGKCPALAMANSIFSAIEVRLRCNPMRPADVLLALR